MTKEWMARNKPNSTNKGQPLLFPELLHDLLEEAENNNEDNIVVAWNADGSSFKIHNKDVFMQRILPRYFRLSQYKSFVRQLNIWGFTCITGGSSKGHYHHYCFVRGKRNLSKGMFREKIKGTGSRIGSKNRNSRRVVAAALPHNIPASRQGPSGVAGFSREEQEGSAQVSGAPFGFLKGTTTMGIPVVGDPLVYHPSSSSVSLESSYDQAPANLLRLEIHDTEDWIDPSTRYRGSIVALTTSDPSHRLLASCTSSASVPAKTSFFFNDAARLVGIFDLPDVERGEGNSFDRSDNQQRGAVIWDQNNMNCCCGASGVSSSDAHENDDRFEILLVHHNPRPQFNDNVNYSNSERPGDDDWLSVFEKKFDASWVET